MPVPAHTQLRKFFLQVWCSSVHIGFAALTQPFQIVKILLAFILGIGAKNTHFHIKRSPINASLSLTIRKIVFGEFKVIQPVYIVPFDKSRSVLV